MSCSRLDNKRFAQIGGIESALVEGSRPEADDDAAGLDIGNSGLRSIYVCYDRSSWNSI